MELPLFKLDNKEFTSIIDSIVSFSEQCIGKGLTYLNFTMDVREMEPSYYQLHITLVDCIGMDLLLTSKDRSKAIGYFVHKSKYFIISGYSGYLEELYKHTSDKKIFTNYGSRYAINTEYTIWDYKYYAPDNKFERTGFFPLCKSEKERIFPLCNDSIDVKHK